MVMVGRVQRIKQQPEDLAQCRTDEDGGVDQEKKKSEEGCLLLDLVENRDVVRKNVF